MKRPCRAALSDPKPLLAAVLLAPLCPGFVFALMMTVAGVLSGEWVGIGTIIGSALFLLVAALLGAALLGYPIAFTLGLPAHFLLYRIGYRSRRAYAITAALLGTLVMPGQRLIYHLLGRALPGTPQVFDQLAFNSLFGAIAGLAFWHIVRPERDCSCSDSNRR